MIVPGYFLRDFQGIFFEAVGGGFLRALMGLFILRASVV